MIKLAYNELPPSKIVEFVEPAVAEEDEEEEVRWVITIKTVEGEKVRTTLPSYHIAGYISGRIHLETPAQDGPLKKKVKSISIKRK